MTSQANYSNYANYSIPLYNIYIYTYILLHISYYNNFYTVIL